MARLLWYVVPVALVPAAVYWLAVDRIGREQQQSIRATLLNEARHHEEQTLSEEAADRIRQIADAARDVVAIAHRAAEHARGALEDGPDPKLPPEPLMEDAGGLLRTTGHGVSAAMVSRATGLGARARRDLDATRRLEAPFVILGLGPVDLSALSIRTASGVLRVVPGLDLSPGRKPVVDPAFRFPSASARPLVDGAGGADPPAVIWSDVYDDSYAGNGNIVSAVALVKGKDGRILGEVGADWVFPRLFQGSEDPKLPDDVEFIFTADGRAVVSAPARRTTPEQVKEVGAVAAKRGDGVLETKRGVGTFIAAPPPALGRTDHRLRKLLDLIDRFLTDTTSLGYTSSEVLESLGRRINKGEPS